MGDKGKKMIGQFQNNEHFIQNPAQPTKKQAFFEALETLCQKILFINPKNFCSINSFN